MICAADVSEPTHIASRKTNMGPVQRLFYVFCPVKIVQVLFSVLAIKQFVVCDTIGKYLAFLLLFVHCMDQEPC